MRIHSDILQPIMIRDAARRARVDLIDFETHKSQSRAAAFTVKLEGESRRRPNGGSSGAGSGYAATWDQWGVFLAALFEIDSNMICGSAKRPVYSNAENFADKTADRFGAPETVMTSDGYRDVFTNYGWPVDAHGDHRFVFEGRVGEQSCTKCSAVSRWSV